MARRRLADLCCPVKDAVLWSTLDWQEARGWAERTGCPLELPPGLDRDDPAAVACAVHHGIHAHGRLAARLDALLESLHAEARAAVEAASPMTVAAWTKGDLDALPWPAAGLLWAVAVDPRPELRGIESWLAWRIQVEGLRARAFGRVEILEPGTRP